MKTYKGVATLLVCCLLLTGCTDSEMDYFKEKSASKIAFWAEGIGEGFDVYKEATADAKGLKEHLIGLSYYLDYIEMGDYYPNRRRDMSWQEVQAAVPICAAAPQLEETFDTVDVISEDIVYLYMRGPADPTATKERYIRIMEESGCKITTRVQKNQSYALGTKQLADDTVLRMKIYFYESTHPLSHNIDIMVNTVKGSV